nr:immunoglobulin heavy chain junction region [Macaca mulatta]MOV49281.1 immunoglobulin heavy chain junction region [Macaca mulatta]MOV49721.1 immunoglobulin heavy chain junction region [Macaca mulatta]MOV50486.1 immunoglobulin heavy chain junction region [Macaca mulatta]MOV50685.1 immunoglobulin heavy chain junction region [Macaca mulatta]
CAREVHGYNNGFEDAFDFW